MFVRNNVRIWWFNMLNILKEKCCQLRILYQGKWPSQTEENKDFYPCTKPENVHHQQYHLARKFFRLPGKLSQIEMYLFTNDRTVLEIVTILVSIKYYFQQHKVMSWEVLHQKRSRQQRLPVKVTRCQIKGKKISKQPL